MSEQKRAWLVSWRGRSCSRDKDRVYIGDYWDGISIWDDPPPIHIAEHKQIASERSDWDTPIPNGQAWVEWFEYSRIYSVTEIDRNLLTDDQLDLFS